MKFCQNRLCRWHINVEDNITSLRAAFPNTDETIAIRRLKIGNRDTQEEFAFCEICANVIAMVHGTKTETPNNEHRNEKLAGAHPQPDAQETPQQTPQS